MISKKLAAEMLEFIKDIATETWRIESEDEREKTLYEARDIIRRAGGK